MGRRSVQILPEKLEKLFRALKTSHCSAKWDWEHVLEALHSEGRQGAVFWNLCENGIYHILFGKMGNKDSRIDCKKCHTNDPRLMELTGVCFSHLLISGATSNRIVQFGETLQQAVSSLLDALVYALEVSDFHSSVLQSLNAIKDSKFKLLPRLQPMSEISVANKFDLALCRVQVLSSTLRTIFECGSVRTLPICLPYICSVFAAAFAVNISDPRHSTPALVSCSKHLLHTFSVIIQSTGMHVLPAVPTLMTSLVYQLEWAAQFARSHPSKDSLTFKLAIYRCLTLLIESVPQVAAPALSRLAPRIITEICLDIAYSAKGSLSQSLMTSDDGLTSYELHVCCSVASIRLTELLFINHSFSLARATSERDDKLKQALFSLSSEIHTLASRLVGLLNKGARLSPTEQVLVKPHLILPFVNAAAAVKDYGFLFTRSNSLFELTKLLLKHPDPTIRVNADRWLRYTFKALPETPLLQSGGGRVEETVRTSSFTQTEVQAQSPAPTQREVGDVAIETVASTEQASVEEAPTSSEELPVATSSSGNNSAVSAVKAATPKRKRGVKHVHFEDSPQQPENKRPRAEPQNPAVVRQRPAVLTTVEAAPQETPVSIQEALCTFDDTLI